MFIVVEQWAFTDLALRNVDSYLILSPLLPYLDGRAGLGMLENIIFSVIV